MLAFEPIAQVHVAVLPYPDSIDLALLTPSERALFDALPEREQRRREWWSARVAGHEALRACGLTDASILRDPDGRPLVEGAELALSHGRTVAAAAASRSLHVGIDVLDPSDQVRLTRIGERVLRGAEPELARAHPQDGLRLLWGAREAVAKATHTGMFMFALTKVHATAIDRAERRIETNRSGIAIRWLELAGGEILVVASATDAAVDRARAQTR